MSSVAAVGPDLHAQGESYPSKSWKEAPWVDGCISTAAPLVVSQPRAITQLYNCNYRSYIKIRMLGSLRCESRSSDTLGTSTKLFLSSALEDLNGDGRPEIITVLAGVNTCGARDCEVVILTQAGAGYKTVFDSYASSIALGPKTDSGWREVITNFTVSVDGVKSGVIWTWKGERYELK